MQTEHLSFGLNSNIRIETTRKLSLMQSWKPIATTSSSLALDGQQKAVLLISGMEADAAKEVDAKALAYRRFLQQAPGVWNRNTLENAHQDRIDKLLGELTEWEIRKVGIESRIQIMRDSQDPERYSDLDRLGLIDDMPV